jgi:hypothetical protein
MQSLRIDVKKLIKLEEDNSFRVKLPDGMNVRAGDQLSLELYFDDSGLHLTHATVTPMRNYEN